MRLHVFTTGTFSVPQRLVYREGSVVSTKALDILVFAIEHPRHGIILFGTGLNRRVAREKERYLGMLLSAFSTVAMANGQDIVSQLEKAKIAKERVRFIILPDLRFDHTGEVESFPAAQVLVGGAAFTVASDEEGDMLFFDHEYDNVRQWEFLDFTGAQPLGTFRAHQDVLKDGSVLVIDVAGATAGGVAVLVRLPHAPVLLCGNLAWTYEQYFRVREPGLWFDRGAWWEHAWRLKKFKELAPELVVFPDHDWKAVESAKTADVILHPFPSAGKD